MLGYGYWSILTYIKETIKLTAAKSGFISSIYPDFVLYLTIIFI